MCLSPYFFASCQYIIPVLRVPMDDSGGRGHEKRHRPQCCERCLAYVSVAVALCCVEPCRKCYVGMLDALLDVPHEGTETEEWVVNIELVKFIEETVNLLVFDDGDYGTVH